MASKLTARSYVARARVHLPFIEVTKEEGEEISAKELREARQTDADVRALLREGAIEEKNRG